MPIKKESFARQRTDHYMEGMEAIVFFLYSHKDRAFTSNEISYETDLNDRELVLRILSDLRKDRRVLERLIFDGKTSNFYYMINVEEIEKAQVPDDSGNGDSSGQDQGSQPKP